MSKLLRFALLAGLVAHYHVLAAPPGSPPGLETYDDGGTTADSYGDAFTQGNDIYDSQSSGSNYQDERYNNPTGATSAFNDNQAASADLGYDEGPAGDPYQDSNGDTGGYSNEAQSPEYGAASNEDYSTSPGAANPGTQSSTNPPRQHNSSPTIQINGPPSAGQKGPSPELLEFLGRPSSDLIIWIGGPNPKDLQHRFNYGLPLVKNKEGAKIIPPSNFPLRMCVSSLGTLPRGFADTYLPEG